MRKISGPKMRTIQGITVLIIQIIFQTTLFWVFATNHSSKLEYLPIPNNHDFVIDLPISQNGFSVCFVIQSLEKN